MTAAMASGESGRRAALVIVSDTAEMRLIVETLTDCGFRATVASQFAEAKTLIAQQAPDAIVADVRLKEFNGLHLALRGKAAKPSMIAIVVSETDDPVLQAEARGLGAIFMVKPLRSAELRAALQRALAARNDDPPPTPPFERRRADRRASAGMLWTPERRAGDRRRPSIAWSALGMAFA